MTLTELTGHIKRWASYQATDCDLAGADEQAANFKTVVQMMGLIESQFKIIEQSDEVIKHYRAEIARLESLVFRP